MLASFLKTHPASGGAGQTSGNEAGMGGMLARFSEIEPACDHRAAFWSKVSARRLASTHAAISNPAEYVLHGARARFSVDQIDWRRSTQCSIRALEPSPCFLFIPHITLRKSNDMSSTHKLRFGP